MSILGNLIKTDPANNPPATDQAVLDWCKAGGGKFQELRVTLVGLAEYVDHDETPITLDAVRHFIEAMRAAAQADVLVDEALMLLRNTGEGLNIGAKASRDIITGLVGGSFTQADADSILAITPELPRYSGPLSIQIIQQARAE